MLLTGDIESYEILRKLYSEEDWKINLQTLLVKLDLAGSIFPLAKILLREDDMIALLKHVQRYQSFEMLELTGSALQTKFNEELVEIYYHLLWDLAPKSKQRESAKLFRDKLKKVRRTPRGKKMVSELLKQLFILYPGWQVLYDEVKAYI